MLLTAMINGLRSVISLALIGMLAAAALTGCVHTRHKGPHHFRADANVTYLSENMAIEFAEQTMAREGYDLAVWRIKPSDQNRRKPDKFVNRFDPNQVRVLFSDGKQHREVSVLLRDGVVTSRMFFGL
jgi:hypothetical protein